MLLVSHTRHKFQYCTAKSLTVALEAFALEAFALEDAHCTEMTVSVMQPGVQEITLYMMLR